MPENDHSKRKRVSHKQINMYSVKPIELQLAVHIDDVKENIPVKSNLGLAMCILKQKIIN